MPSALGLVHLYVAMASYLNRAVAKEGGEDWRREHGDDGQQDCNAGCGKKDQ